MKSEFLIVARRLMETERRPMSPRELVDMGQKQQLFSDNVAGKTPFQTMKSKLSVHIRRFGDVSPFVRTAPGRFYLRRLLDGKKPPFDAKPIRPPKIREKVLVYRTAELDAVTTWQGLQTTWKRAAKTILTRLQPHYIHRFDVEQDNEYTQVLTYVLVCKGDSILAYRRGTYNRVDKFLQGALCVGFGGHVVETDLDLFNVDSLGIFECASRELMEELKLPSADIQRLRQRDGLEVIGIINDDSSDVGRRHLAFVMRYEVSSDARWNQPERGEKAITQLRWISMQDPGRVWLWTFEYWSQLCLREFAPRLLLVGPAYRLLRRMPLRPPHILCVIGPVGSGKTLATEVLKDDFGYDEINTGAVVAQLLGVPPVPQTPRAKFQEGAWRFISESSGPERLARRLLEIAHEKNTPRILIDGLRQRATLENLRKFAGDTKIGIVFVHTPADLAFSFYAERIAQGASMNEFLSVRSAPVESEVEGLIAIADAVLYNWTGRLQYRETIQELMAELGITEVGWQ
jgi:predicted NUDIX family phosphoesterase/dephospho-CoA kinase